METRRRIDLCTCGKPREDAIHGLKTSRGIMQTPFDSTSHPFHPNPQPAQPPTPPLFHRIHAVRINNVWITEVYGSGKMGHGQAKEWLAAVEAAIEDLKEKG